MSWFIDWINSFRRAVPKQQHDLSDLYHGSGYLGRFVSEIKKIANGLSELGEPIRAVFVKDLRLVEFRLPSGEVFAELCIEGCCCEETDAYVSPGSLSEYAVRQFLVLHPRVRVHVADRNKWREYGSRSMAV